MTPLPASSAHEKVATTLTAQACRLRKCAKPSLVCLTGDTGVGKTTIARTVVAHLPLVHVRNDELRVRTFPNPAFSRREDEELFTAIDAVVTGLLRDGYAVLWDAQFASRRIRRTKVTTFQRRGLDVCFLHVQLEETVRSVRLLERSRSRLHGPERDYFYTDALEVKRRGRQHPYEAPGPDEPVLCLNNNIDGKAELVARDLVHELSRRFGMAPCD